MPERHALATNRPRPWLALTILVLSPSTAHPDGIPARLPEIVFEDNLTDAERTQLAEGVAKVRKSVFFVGHPNGANGAAFLVSREKRLLATAAHVADLVAKCGSLIAIPDGTAAAYRVQRIYYHPDALRLLDQGLHVRSEHVEDGEISTRGPDVALLELAPGGPELPEACMLATDEELCSSGGTPIVGLGHPGSRMLAWPAGVRPISAKSAPGKLRRMTGLFPDDQTDLPIARRRRVVYTGDAGNHGFSGGPLCLANGHVIAIVSHGIVQRDLQKTQVSMRIDCVRDMLTHFRPTELLFIQPSELDTAAMRVSGAVESADDPRLPRLRQAVARFKESKALVESGHYSLAVHLCNELILQFPNYAHLYVIRGHSYLMFAFYTNSDPELRSRMLAWARDDFLRASEVDPDFAAIKAQAFACRLQLISLRQDRQDLRALASEIDHEVDNPAQSQASLAEFLNVRAQCRAVRGNLAGAKTDIDEAVRLASTRPSHWDVLAYIADSLKDPATAAEARRISHELAKQRPSD